MLFFKKNKVKVDEREVRFYKIPYDQFKEDWKKLYGRIDEQVLQNMYNSITLPVRGTTESAGYDFKTPFGFKIERGENIVIPTGIACDMKHNQCLLIYPRSGMGFKYRLSLANTVGVIDADYRNHILIKLCFDGLQEGCGLELKSKHDDSNVSFDVAQLDAERINTLEVQMGDKIAQGIINEYQTTFNDCVRKMRNGGGFGSTGR